MKKIEVSNEVLERLGAYITSFDDTPTSVIDRLLVFVEKIAPADVTGLHRLHLSKPDTVDVKDVFVVKSSGIDTKNTRQHLTTEAIEFCYSEGVKAFNSGNWKAGYGQGHKRLVSGFDMHPVSANIYLNALRNMLLGRRYTSIISSEAVDIFLHNINRDFPDRLPQALDSLRLHFERLMERYNNPCRKLREIHAKYSKSSQP